MALPLNLDLQTEQRDDTPAIRTHQLFDRSPETLLNFYGTGENPGPAATTSTSTTTQQSTVALAHQNYDYYLPLYQAALKGNWAAAKIFLDNDPSAATAGINRASMTALHVAAGEGRSEFVEKMVAYLPVEALKVRDLAGFTALHYAAIAGSLRSAVALVKKNPALTNVLDSTGQTPLLIAARFVYGSDSDVLWYLTLMTSDEEGGHLFTGPHAMNLVLMLLLSGSIDIVLYLLQRNSNLATATTAEGASLLSMLSVIPSNFLSGTRLGFWESCIYSLIPVQKSNGPPYSVTSIVENARGGGSNQVLGPLQRLFFRALGLITPNCIKRLREAKHRHQCAIELFKRVCTKIQSQGSLTQYLRSQRGLQYSAANLGITEVLKIMYQLCPDLTWVSVEGLDKYMIHVAVENRRENVFNLLCGKNARNKIQSDHTSSSGTTIMHIAAKLAPFPQLSSVSGAALQMQREMKWFKEAEKLVHPYTRSCKNERRKTAREVFTVVFAAAFTVPGGNNSDNGIPIFLNTDAFLVFAISDAPALLSSLTSVLMFLSILTARYAEEDFAEEDFIHTLPKRLIIGLASLFLAITTMMVAFGAALSIVLHRRLKWISVPTVLLGSVPVAIFTLLQLPLFIEMVRSTFGFTFLPLSPW